MSLFVSVYDIGYNVVSDVVYDSFSNVTFFIREETESKFLTHSLFINIFQYVVNAIESAPKLRYSLRSSLQRPL